DPRWKYGTPPQGNANFAWVQHFIHHLAPTGTAGFVLANGALSSRATGESDVRERLINDDLVDCIVSLQDRLFFNTAIPVTLGFITQGRKGNKNRAGADAVLCKGARMLGEWGTRRPSAAAAHVIPRSPTTRNVSRTEGPATTCRDDD